MTDVWEGALFYKKSPKSRSKQISPAIAWDLPFSLPVMLEIVALDAAALFPVSILPHFSLFPNGNGDYNKAEWFKFMNYLHSTSKVGLVHLDGWDLIVQPPTSKPRGHDECLRVSYRSSTQKAGQLSPVAAQVKVAVTEAVPVPSRGIARSQTETHHRFEGGWAETHPRFLESLRQQHASWLFGGIAELVDNARDAKATRLSISVSLGELGGQPIHMLCIEDDGSGMNHQDICLMLTFGHARPGSEDTRQIGRFGVGFKSGSMQIGKDAIVFTQSANTRSLAFLSTSFNKNKEILEVPKVTWRKRCGGGMDYDTDAQTRSEAEERIKAVGQHSPFNIFRIGLEFGKIDEHGTGTRIFVYNLDRWGSEYKLKWDGDEKDDITIRSKRIRSRPGQTSNKVPLDYSLRSYLEVLFLDPEMDMFVNGVKVKCRRLDKSLIQTVERKTTIQGAELTLTIGFSKEEKELGNCGVFLYWHRRLIEAYKRVGDMLHSADMGGVIAVIDTTPLMTSKDWVGVLNTKQGFEDSEQYADLEKWLADCCNSYWEEHFDGDHHMLDDLNAPLEEENEWVQCVKCHKWRRMPSTGYAYGDQWFCYMPPYNGNCQIVEERQEADEFTTSVGRQKEGRTVAAIPPPATNITKKRPTTTEGQEVTPKKRLRQGRKRRGR